MPKTPFKNGLKHLYFPRVNHIEDNVVPLLNCLIIDAAGGPASLGFQWGIAALYSMAMR